MCVLLMHLKISDFRLIAPKFNTCFMHKAGINFRHDSLKCLNPCVDALRGLSTVYVKWVGWSRAHGAPHCLRVPPRQRSGGCSSLRCGAGAAVLAAAVAVGVPTDFERHWEMERGARGFMSKHKGKTPLQLPAGEGVSTVQAGPLIVAPLRLSLRVGLLAGQCSPAQAGHLTAWPGFRGP